MSASIDSPDGDPQRPGRALRILQIGAGAMGSRRLRDVSSLHDIELAVFDTRPDRSERAAERFGVPGFGSLDAGLDWGPDAIIISTPPDVHSEFVELALDRGLHHFSEENIWTYDHERVAKVSADKSLVSAPSCSFHFLPIVQELKRVVSDELGELHSYQMLLSTFGENWHPDDGPDFYARQRSTAAAREMTPFELVWLNWVFGPPSHVLGAVLAADHSDQPTEDTWCLQMQIGRAAGQLAVAHSCPADIRCGTALGDNGWVSFDIFAGTIQRDLPGVGLRDVRHVGAQADDLEATYATEISTFIDAVRGHGIWPHSYEASSIATATLAAGEHSSLTGQRVPVVASRQPGTLPTDQPPPIEA